MPHAASDGEVVGANMERMAVFDPLQRFVETILSRRFC
jgi:hypothetical protein